MLTWLIEKLLPPMSRRTKWAMAILALGMAAMVLVPDRDPIPTPLESLRAAAIHGNEDAAESALRQGAAVDARDDIGMTPLIEAARAGHLRVCEKLLRAGANGNAVTPVYGTALMQAAFYDHEDVVRLLLRSGADPAYRNENSIDAAQLATQGGNLALAGELQMAIHSCCH